MEYLKDKNIYQGCYICAKTEDLEYGDLMEHVSDHVRGDFKCIHCLRYLKNYTLRGIAYHVATCSARSHYEIEHSKRESFIACHIHEFYFDEWRQGRFRRAVEIEFRRWATNQVNSILEIRRKRPERRLFIERAEMLLTKSIPSAAKRQIKRMLNCEAVYDALWECPPVKRDWVRATKLSKLNGGYDDHHGLRKMVLMKNHQQSGAKGPRLEKEHNLEIEINY